MKVLAVLLILISYLMELKLSELKTENQKEVFFRYLSIAEHYISTENEKEAEKILKNLSILKYLSIHIICFFVKKKY